MAKKPNQIGKDLSLESVGVACFAGGMLMFQSSKLWEGTALVAAGVIAFAVKYHLR